MSRLGMEAKVYRNTGTYATPTWDEVTCVEDITLNVEHGEAEVGKRAGDWIGVLLGKKRGNIELTLITDSTDLDWVAIRDAWINKTSIEFAILDGAVGTSGSEGLRGTFVVTNFSRPEPLEDTVKYTATIKPYANAANEPEWMLIP